MSDGSVRITFEPIESNCCVFEVEGFVYCEAMHPPDPALILLLVDFSDSVGDIRPPSTWAIDFIGLVAKECRRSDRIAVGIVGLPMVLDTATVEDWESGRLRHSLADKVEKTVDDAQKRGTWLVPPIKACADQVGKPDYCLVTGDGAWFDELEASREMSGSPLTLVGSHGSTADKSLSVTDALTTVSRVTVECEKPDAHYDKNRGAFVDVEGVAWERTLEPAFRSEPEATWRIASAYLAPGQCVPEWPSLRLERAVSESPVSLGLAEAAREYRQQRRREPEWQWDLELAKKLAEADNDHAIKGTCGACGKTADFRPCSCQCPNCSGVAFWKADPEAQRAWLNREQPVALLLDLEAGKAMWIKGETALPCGTVVREAFRWCFKDPSGTPTPLDRIILEDRYALLGTQRTR